MSGRFARHARTVSLFTLVSRLTGLLRDAALSRVFGAGGLMDAFFFAFMIPNLFRRLFGEGALAAAFLPEYTQLVGDDPVTARRLATLVIGAVVVGLGSLVAIGEVILLVIAATGDESNLAVRLMLITLPYAPLVCAVAIFGAMLQVHGRFGPPAAAPIVLNGCLIAATLVPTAVNETRHVGLVALAVIVAGAIQIAWCLWALRDIGWLDRHALAALSHFKRILRLAGPMILGLGVLQLNTFLDGVIASYPTSVGPSIFGYAYPLDEGAMASISFAQRLYQFPLGVFGIAVATAIFPLLARQAGSPDEFTATIRRGLRLVVFIGLPASAGLILIRQPLTSVIFQGGRFGVEDTHAVGRILLGYAPAVWAYSMVHVLTRAFYARGDSMTPVRIAVVMVVLNVVLNCTLIWTPLGTSGLAWSTAACSILQSLVLLRVLGRRLDLDIGHAVRRSWGKSVLLTAGMTLVAVAITQVFTGTGGWWMSMAHLIAVVVGGMVTVAQGARLLAMPELNWAIGRAG